MSRQATTDDSAHTQRYGVGFDDDTQRQAANGRDTGALIAELREYLNHFINAKVDSIKMSVRSIVLYAVLGILGLIIGGTMLIAATVLLLNGIANGIGALFQYDKPWVGQLIVGGLILAATIVGAMLLIKKMTGGSKKLTVEKYEARQRSQQAQFGRDAKHFT